MKSTLPQITEWADGYTESELEVAIKYLESLRDNCSQVIEDNLTSSMKGELLVCRIISLIILELRMLQTRRI